MNLSYSLKYSRNDKRITKNTHRTFNLRILSNDTFFFHFNNLIIRIFLVTCIIANKFIFRSRLLPIYDVHVSRKSHIKLFY